MATSFYNYEFIWAAFQKTQHTTEKIVQSQDLRHLFRRSNNISYLCSQQAFILPVNLRMLLFKNNVLYHGETIMRRNNSNEKMSDYHLCIHFARKKKRITRFKIWKSRESDKISNVLLINRAMNATSSWRSWCISILVNANFASK